MDITKLKPAERQIEIVHPESGENLGIRVALVSINDEKLKNIKRNITNQKLKLDARGKHFKVDDLEENEDAILVGAITGWEWYGDVKFHDAKPVFNPQTVRQVMNELYWFKDQIREALNDERGFF